MSSYVSLYWRQALTAQPRRMGCAVPKPVFDPKSRMMGFANGAAHPTELR
jgi:hypothetical protein